MGERHPCLECRKHVRLNQHAVQCEKCDGWQHRVCDTGISVADYRRAVNGTFDISFVCKSCTGDQTDDTVREIPDGSFHVDVSFEEPVVIHERSLGDAPLPNEIMADVPLTFEVIEKASQKGADLLVDSAGYSYNIKDRRGKCVRWSCSVKNKRMRCLAIVAEKEGSFKFGRTQHIHAPDPARGLTAKVSKKAKEVACRTVFTSAREIAVQARNEIANGTEVGKVKDENIARRANRKRAAMRPADPKDMNFLLNHDALPDGFWRDDIEVEGRRHLLFSTDKQLDVLRSAARWYVDGTFKCMRFPFVMLLTIHAFVRRADCSKQVPLLFALMSGRNTRDYTAVFESVKNLLGVNAVEGMVIDYEKALWKASRRVFPNIRLSGCAFHWGQAVWSHVQNLGLKTQYTRDQATHSYIRKLLSLPFLPSEHIRPTFESMVEFNTSDALNPLLEYLNRHWFSSSVWSVEEWCVYGQAVRTNNDVEGWHRRLNMKTGVSPPFYVVIGLLHKEGKEVEEQVQLVSELCLKRIQRAIYRSMQAEVFAIWDSYRAGKLSTSGLLKKVSVLYGHRVTIDNE